MDKLARNRLHRSATRNAQPVEAGSLHAAISIEMPGEDRDARFVTVPLWHDPFVLVGPKRLLSSVLGADARRAMSAMPWVLPRVGSDCDRLITTHLALHGIRASPVGRTDDWRLVQEMAVTLQSIAYVPSWAPRRTRNSSGSIPASHSPGDCYYAACWTTGAWPLY
ncbi:LysR family transcriptional regulator substrate-binding protein [Nocardia sp. CA2R105]|uniref:LysR family transcriptional regulator substrate-binding protein n=1 Tax=Nocardia coffeae TaxID=2873381 RepID=UPI001CA7587F|nr:LysR family transcriptional regulator substrate-binding protein [Nocardia coffeae]